MKKDPWRYDGKKVVINGCSSGMGEAATLELLRLGAEVHGVDIQDAPVELASFQKVDLRDRAQIDAALQAIGDDIDCSFYCAGLPGTFPPLEIMLVNFVNMRYWTLEIAKRMSRGGAMAIISSMAGKAWASRRTELEELMATPDPETAFAWCENHLKVVADGYLFSKMCSQFFGMQIAAELIGKGIRINVLNPAPTQSPMMKDFEAVAPAALIDVYTQPIDRRAEPIEMALPLVFLNSDAASYINGHNLNVDGGFAGSIDSGVLDENALFTKALAG
jgi:NAD(P)-dependent dehydrogenase (short-subunit alcohol dehydrogenase family)